MKDEYTLNLEKVIRQMLKPIKNIPFGLVIEAISNKAVIPFDKDSPIDKALLNDLISIANLSGKEINKNGITSSRVNEVGNKIETYVTNELNKFGYKAGKPTTNSGKVKTTGYPDIVFVDKDKRTNYLECKTFNKDNIDTTFRSFYLSPSEDFKITSDGHHFIISYEMVEQRRNTTSNVYRCKSWKLLSIEKLLVDVKYEFNSNNAHLYRNELLLAEGQVDF